MIPIFRAKLRPPATPAHWVERGRLSRLLDELVALPLAAVVAPAGTGKTSLLSAWATEAKVRTAWLSLDETDGDAVQFWRGVVAALETVEPGCGEGAQELLRRRKGVNDSVAQLLVDLEANDRPSVVLIIDDLHLVDGNEVVAGPFAQFVLHLPAWLHVVLISRHQPKLPLGRLRGHGHLGELHYPELRFSHDEAIVLVSRLLPSMPAAEVEIVAEEANGWAASLQLAAIAARSERAQTGRDKPGVQVEMQVVDYVFNEVLAAEDPEMVEVLTDISVVDRVNPSLAHALTRRRDAVDLLLRAEERGLFVSRLAPEGWFELHSLVREALVSDQSKRSPERSAERHARAGKWYEAEDEVALAFEHFLAAGQPKTALRLLAATQAELYDSGREATIRRCISAIPDAAVNNDLGTMIDFASCHSLVGRRRFQELVEQTRWLANQAPVDRTLQARLMMLEGMAAIVNCDWATAGARAREALEALGDGWWRDPLGWFGWNNVARDVALSERWDESLGEVRQAALCLKRDPKRRVAFEGTHALGLALTGRPVDALRVAGGVRHTADVVNMTMLRAELDAAEALAYREMGDPSRAVPRLEDLSVTSAETMLFARVLGMAALVEAYLDGGAIDAASATFVQLRCLVADQGVATEGRSWLARAGTLVDLASGDTEGARRWSGLVEDDFWTGVSAARVHLAEMDRPTALVALDSAVPRCVRHEVVLALLRARAVGDHNAEAVKYASAAIDLAVSNGMLQTVASEGAEVAELVEASAWRAPAHWLDRFRRTVAPVGGSRFKTPVHLVEPLTERELDVVRFLPSRLTVREIASELYISPNTLKFHLKVIYRKLDVSSRTQASDVARRMIWGS